MLGKLKSFSFRQNLLCFLVSWQTQVHYSIGGFYMNRLVHISWECKYHIVFAPKFRQQAIYGKLKVEIGKTTLELVIKRSSLSLAISIPT